MFEVKIRALNQNDMPRIMEINQYHLSNHWTEDKFKTVFDNNLYIIGLFIDNEDGEVLIGYSVYLICLAEVRILNFILHPQYRKNGFASKLLKYIINDSSEIGAKYIMLEVWVGNFTAIKLYNNHGFRVISNRKDFYVGIYPKDAYLMELQIGDYS